MFSFELSFFTLPRIYFFLFHAGSGLPRFRLLKFNLQLDCLGLNSLFYIRPQLYPWCNIIIKIKVYSRLLTSCANERIKRWNTIQSAWGWCQVSKCHLSHSFFRDLNHGYKTLSVENFRGIGWAPIQTGRKFLLHRRLNPLRFSWYEFSASYFKPEYPLRILNPLAATS